MKDKSLKSQPPDHKNDTPPPDQGLWKDSALIEQEWRDAPIDESEIGIWEQSAKTNQEWIDAPIDESEIGVWEQPPLANQEWRDVPIDQNEIGIWEQTNSVNQEWRDEIADESENEIWEQAALVEQEWQDAPVDQDETGIWDQTPTSESEWKEAPIKDEIEEKIKDGMIFLPQIVETQYYPLIPLIGYGFLGLWLFDQIGIIYPIKISEPAWIVETLGQITERIPTVWIGLLLVFFRRQGYTRKWEVGILKFLSWFSLVLAIIYLLMTPMLIGNTVRVYRLIDTQIDARSSQQVQKLKSARDQIKQTKEQDISAYLQYRNNQENNTQGLSPSQFKESLLLQADKNLNELEASTKSLKDSQLGDLVKRVIKWTFGNLMSVIICLWIWYLTSWTRIKNLELDSKV